MGFRIEVGEGESIKQAMRRLKAFVSCRRRQLGEWEWRHTNPGEFERWLEGKKAIRRSMHARLKG